MGWYTAEKEPDETDDPADEEEEAVTFLLRAAGYTPEANVATERIFADFNASMRKSNRSHVSFILARPLES